MKNNYLNLLLDPSGYIVVNKNLIKILNLGATVMIGELIGEYNYYLNKNKLVDNKWFFSTENNLQKNTGLARREQEKAIKKLKEEGIIETKKMGLPLKTYYSINFDKLEDLLKNFVNEEAKNYTENEEINEVEEQPKNKENELLKDDEKNEENKDFLGINAPDTLTDEALTPKDKLYEDTIEIIKELYDSNSDYINISGKQVEMAKIKKRLEKLTKEHIDYIVESLLNTNKKSQIKNIKAYIIATIYNANNTLTLYNLNKENDKWKQEFDKLFKEDAFNLLKKYK